MPDGLSTKQLGELGLESTNGLAWKGTVALYGIFVELTMHAFSENSFSRRRWDKDPTKSDVYIAPDYLWDDKVVEKRPAVIVSLGDISCQPQQGMMGGGRTGSDMCYETGTAHHYSDIKSGSITWRVIAETRGEALNILDELFRYFNVMQDVIRRDLCFTDFHVAQVSPLVLVKEARERLQGGLLAQFSYEDCWTLVEQAPKVRIDVHAEAVES